MKIKVKLKKVFSRLFVAVCFFIAFLVFAGNKSSNSGNSILLKGTDLNIAIINAGKVLWEYQVPSTGKVFAFAGPTFEIDGKILDCKLVDIQKIGLPVRLNIGVT